MESSTDNIVKYYLDTFAQFSANFGINTVPYISLKRKEFGFRGWQKNERKDTEFVVLGFKLYLNLINFMIWVSF